MRAEQRAERRRNLKKHADSDVGETLMHVGRRRARRCGDHRDERRADGVTNVDFENEGEQGHEDYAAAQASERAHQAGDQRTEAHHQAKFQCCHNGGRVREFIW